MTEARLELEIGAWTGFHVFQLKSFSPTDNCGLYYKTITIVIDAPSVVKSDAPNCSVTY